MNLDTDSLLKNVTIPFMGLGVLAAYASLVERARPKPIQPMHTFPIYEDTISITWDDYAVCRL